MASATVNAQPDLGTESEGKNIILLTVATTFTTQPVTIP